MGEIFFIWPDVLFIHVLLLGGLFKPCNSVLAASEQVNGALFGRSLRIEVGGSFRNLQDSLWTMCFGGTHFLHYFLGISWISLIPLAPLSLVGFYM